MNENCAALPLTEKLLSQWAFWALFLTPYYTSQTSHALTDGELQGLYEQSLREELPSSP